MVQVAPWWTVRLACRYGCVRVPTRRSPSCWTGTADWVTVRLCPPARRGYGYGSGSAVVDGTAGVPVRVCQGSYAPLQAIGVVRHAGRRYGSALPTLPHRVF